MITHVAIKKDGKVYSLPKPNRHHNVIQHMARVLKMPTPITGEQGFVDDKGRFLGREDGRAHALKIGQVEKTLEPDLLYSEDLW